MRAGAQRRHHKVKLVYGALEDCGARRAGGRRVGSGHRHPSRRADARRRGRRGRRCRRSRPTSAAPITCSRRAACTPRSSKRSSSRRATRSTASSPELPYTEETPLRARHPYDVSKACADLLAQTYHDTYGLPVAHRALRQHLRRRRSELEPDRPRHDSIAAARRAADHPQRRHVRARLPLREGCRLGVSRVWPRRCAHGHVRGRGRQLRRRRPAHGARSRRRPAAADRPRRISRPTFRTPRRPRSASSGCRSTRPRALLGWTPVVHDGAGAGARRSTGIERWFADWERA